MNITNKQKLLLVFLLVVTVFLFTTYYKYPTHFDHYSLGQYTYATIEKGYALLKKATKLEIKGRINEALIAYQEIIAKYPNTSVGHDAQAS